MYRLKYYTTTGQLLTKYFDTLKEAIDYSIYKTPFQSFYGIDKVEV